ncbi:hypothetical protein CVT26_013522 [Gymnopilus dilepis]|uniref:Uncharacterized protein n=1 Tax=Gymnopilus dilepis TaxID=231916 RepID=A0A409Y5P2_9AGAR|nr:hypothetical protein CVT26_013522 [Gymnopilus dilepis]
MPHQYMRVASYNALPLVQEADKRFEQQLASAGLSRDEFFAQLAPLFLDAGVAGQYAACLVHRHYLLMDGERMVTRGSSSRPASVDDSPNIVADSWLPTGEAFEYRYTTEPAIATPPPKLFFDRFRSIMDKYRIDTVGICSAPDVTNLAPDFVLLERPGSHDREQVTNIVPRSSLIGNSTAVEAIWVAEQDSQGLAKIFQSLQSLPIFAILVLSWLV